MTSHDRFLLMRTFGSFFVGSWLRDPGYRATLPKMPIFIAAVVLVRNRQSSRSGSDWSRQGNLSFCVLCSTRSTHEISLFGTNMEYVYSEKEATRLKPDPALTYSTSVRISFQPCLGRLERTSPEKSDTHDG